MTIAEQRRRHRQRREETRGEILRAAGELLMERPYREISVDAVMARAGHSRTVFYRHFDDLPEVLLALFAAQWSAIGSTAAEWAARDEAGPGAAREYLGWLVDFFHRNGRLVAALHEASHHDDQVEAFRRTIVAELVDLAADAFSRWTPRPNVDGLDARELASALVLMLDRYLVDALGEREVDPDAVLEVTWTIWTRTLFPAE